MSRSEQSRGLVIKSDTKAKHAKPFRRRRGKNSILKVTAGREKFNKIK